MAINLQDLIDIDLLAYFKSKLDLLLAGKVDKEAGKVLSSNDYTAEDKAKLTNIAAGAQVNVLEGIQKNGSTVSITNKIANISVPTKTSDLTNDSGFITTADVPDGATASTTVPLMDGTGTVGTSTAFARGDHVHPSDTSKLDVTGNAYRALSIPFGQVEDNSTTTNFIAQVYGITELRDGMCAYIKNGVVSSELNCTLNVNGLGAKPIYQTLANAESVGTAFAINSTMLFVYNSSRITGGCWDMFYGQDIIGRQLGVNELTLPVNGTTAGHQLLFVYTTYSRNAEMSFTPATTDTGINPSSRKSVNTQLINPFGPIFYYSDLATISTSSRPPASSLWRQGIIELGSSFNTTDSNLTLTSWQPVYLKCTPHDSGHLAAMDTNTPIIQYIPDVDDGSIYILLGIATSATTMELLPTHPVYYYVSGDPFGSVQVWTGKRNPTKVSDLTNDSGFISSANVYTKTEIDQKLVGAMNYKGTKASTLELPVSGNSQGDVWHISADGSEWAWNGTQWEELGTAIDLSGYVEESEISLATNAQIDAIFE